MAYSSNKRLVLQNIWHKMLKRCFDPECNVYRYYGARGISVCQKWVDSFQVFYDDMAPRPRGVDGKLMQLDRIDNEGHYEPGNVRWATSKENNRNKRSNRLLTHRGLTQPASAWAEQIGINPFTLYDRLDAGWSVDKALTTPVKKQTRLRFLTLDDVTLSIPQWAIKTGIQRDTIYDRLRRGWSVQRTLTEPFMPRFAKIK